MKEIPGLRKGEGTISLGCRRGRVSVKTGDAYPIFKAAHLKEAGGAHRAGWSSQRGERRWRETRDPARTHPNHLGCLG